MTKQKSNGKSKSYEILGKTNLRKTKWTNVFALKQTPFVEAIFTSLRDEKTNTADFGTATHDISMLLIGETLNLIPYRLVKITTPTGETTSGVRTATKICAVPIIRAGLPMATAVRQYIPSAAIGHIVIQRIEATAKPKFLLDKLPKLSLDMSILLLDPMLATGGSALSAIDHIIKKGAKPNQIIFANIISCPEGITAVMEKYPELTLVTGWIDRELNKQSYIMPGLGDFGDRYWGA